MITGHSYISMVLPQLEGKGDLCVCVCVCVGGGGGGVSNHNVKSLTATKGVCWTF